MSHERSRPLDRTGSQNTAGAESSTYTSASGKLIALEIELRGIGRAVELVPESWAWPLAQRTSTAASTARTIRGQAFR